MESIINGTNSTEDQLAKDWTEPVPDFIKIVLYFFGTITIVVNLPSIFIVLASYWRKKKLSYVHILSLSFTDGLLGIAWILLTETLNGDEMRYFSCFFRCSFLAITFMASMFQVLGICIDRVLVVGMDATNVRTKRNKVAGCVIILSLTSACVITVIMSCTSTISYTPYIKCSFDNMFGDHKRRAYGIFGAVFGLTQIGCLVAMVILLQFLLKYNLKLRNSAVREVKSSDIRLCVTTALIAVLYFVCNSPVTVVYLKDAFTSDLTSSRFLRNVSFLFAGLSSALNPFIYLFRIKAFRVLCSDNVKYFISCDNSVVPSDIDIPRNEIQVQNNDNNTSPLRNDALG